LRDASMRGAARPLDVLMDDRDQLLIEISVAAGRHPDKVDALRCRLAALQKLIDDQTI
jgi:hypothetical protein